ncbi:MAG: hypothetical protein KDA41_02485, partial [Planctomycetales bacterium]|nr:hypothetical protein [Planctomycetales bacterium]
MKRNLLTAAFLFLALGAVVFAQKPEGRGKPRGEGRPMGPPQGAEGLKNRLMGGFDGDKNGELDQRERQQAVFALRNRQALAARGIAPVITDQEVVAMFDADGNMQLDATEVLQACQALDAVLGQGAHQM